jgi:uncharacterized protein
MRCTHCGICCTETEMLLCEKDITRLAKRGFDKSYFAKFNRQGYVHLKNREGYCVFYDKSRKRCSVYVDRPSGCRVYPVILDEDTGIILDGICPNTSTINNVEKNLKGQRVIRLLETIDCEAINRRS